MGDKTKGLFGKFRVERTDGSSSPGGKHAACEYFVLDISHDRYAIPALLAYADACEAEYPLLAADIRDRWIRGYEYRLPGSSDWISCLRSAYEKYKSNPNIEVRIVTK